MKIIGILTLLCGFIVIQGCCALGFLVAKDKRSPWEISRDRQAAALAEIAETEKTEKGIVVRLKSDILFETGESELSHKADRQIQRLADVLIKYPGNSITVVGHTDNVGSNADNMILSRHRAQSVKNGLVNDGVAPKAVISRGMGETEPLVANDSDEHRAINRRAELRIQAGE